ncbi:MAG TPA: nucleotidyltransferase [Clostridiaceae bacterium]|nr:nucleotidyltransferase [Clostridiaceae bacterium]
MKTAAIISEYNPFHKGHEYQISVTREKGEATHVIALMSGNFVQRGLPSIIDKYRRADMAILGGADLVLELPAVYALSSAEFFAEGSVRILNALNGVDMLSFGSEEGNLDSLYSLAQILADEPDDFKEELKNELSEGQSYAKARNHALKKLYPHLDVDFIQSPNNILGIEYLKALIRTDSKIAPFTLKRKGKGYHDLDLVEEEFASATALRQSILEDGSIKNFIPHDIYEYIEKLKDEKYPFMTQENFKDLLLYRLIAEEDSLSNIQEASEGLNHRIISHLSSLKNNDVETFIDAIKTKRYARTRISRILIQFLLSFDREPIDVLRRKTPEAVKILALNDRGREILSSLRKDREIDIVHNFGKRTDDFQKIDQKASRIYALKNYAYDPNWDFTGYRNR